MQSTVTFAKSTLESGLDELNAMTSRECVPILGLSVTADITPVLLSILNSIESSGGSTGAVGVIKQQNILLNYYDVYMLNIKPNSTQFKHKNRQFSNHVIPLAVAVLQLLRCHTGCFSLHPCIP